MKKIMTIICIMMLIASVCHANMKLIHVHCIYERAGEVETLKLTYAEKDIENATISHLRDTIANRLNISLRDIIYISITFLDEPLM